MWRRNGRGRKLWTRARENRAEAGLSPSRVTHGTDTLPRFVDSHTLLMDDIEVGLLLYSGVAERFGSNLLDWRPAGLYEADDGIIDIRPNEETEISVQVDFKNRPIFPPQP